jgi:hypothetical protein
MPGVDNLRAFPYLLPCLAGVRGFKLKEELRSYLAEHFDESAMI